MLGGATFAIMVAFGVFTYMSHDLPSVDVLKNISLQTPLRVYTSDGKLFALFGEKRRIPLTLDAVPPRLLRAFIAAEDADFLKHSGIDYAGLLRAAYVLIKTGEKRHGGSTITMQIARNFFLGNERTFTRKIKEIILALTIERKFTKEEILSLYLNKIFLGHQAYGIGAAAEVYYGKKVDELTLPEAAMIAGLPKAPSRYNPITNPEKAIDRRNYVLGRMLESGFIDDEEYAQAKQTLVSAQWHRPQLQAKAPYVAEMVRAEMIKRYGKKVYTDGFSVRTTIDSNLQAAANKSVYENLIKYDRRHGYRGPEARVSEGARLDKIRVVGDLYPAQVISVLDEDAQLLMQDGIYVSLDKEGYQWARSRIDENRRGAWPQKAADVMTVGDIVRLRLSANGTWKLSQLPDIQGALVSLDVKTGRVLSLVGGLDFRRSKFNRAIQAERQIGSGFKPFVYAVALERGYTPASIISDAPIVIPGKGRTWRPSNYSRSFKGPISLRKALAYSNNLAAINLTDSIGLSTIKERVARFGFTPTTVPDDLTMALGSGQVTPMILAQAYMVFANGGYVIESNIIDNVSLDGNEIYRVEPPEYCLECPSDELIETEMPDGDNLGDYVLADREFLEKMFSGNAATDDKATVTDESAAIADKVHKKEAERVLEWDTNYQMISMLKDVIRYGTGKRARSLQRRSLAGKTGTTNDQRDAWFSGFSPDIATVSWVGFDDFSPMGKKEVGSVAALPIWIDYMREALKNKSPQVYERPPTIVNARIDPRSGLLARPEVNEKDTIVESFRQRYVPSRFAPVHVDATKPQEQHKLF